MSSHLLFLFLFFLFHLSWDIGTSLVVVLRGVGLTSLLARALTEPLGQLGCLTTEIKPSSFYS